MRVFDGLERVLAFSLVRGKLGLKLLHALVEDLTLLNKVLLLLLLTASEICLYFFEVGSYCVFVILSYKVN